MTQRQEVSQGQEGATLGAVMERHEPAQWRVQWKLEKREGDWNGEQIDAGLAPDPYEVIEREGVD